MNNPRSVRKFEAIVLLLPILILFNARFSYQEFPLRLNTPLLNSFVFQNIYWITSSLIIFHFLCEIYIYKFTSQSGLKRLETISSQTLLTADDEREELAQNRAGYAAYLTLQNLLNSFTVIFAIIAITLNFVPWYIPWILLVISFIGSRTYYRELRNYGLDIREKFNTHFKKGTK